MKFKAVKGTRDYYPDVMRIRNLIVDTWRRVSLRNGFEEYDSPIFEYLDLFTAKSGDEIASQLFSFTDRGDRNLAIRPEITPSLARMVNARINALPRPVKWFSVPRLCRAENPQKGRLREFFQWNIDIIGEDSELADAECALVAIDALRELGLDSSEVELRYSSRALLSEVLTVSQLAEDDIPKVLAVLDKKAKLSADAFAEMLTEAVPDAAISAVVGKFMEMTDVPVRPIEEIAGALGISMSETMAAEHGKLNRFAGHLERFGIDGWCVYDPCVVRGLAYYTGVVYEVFDKSKSLRAVAGGGRYDNLLQVLGGPQVGATGFGMGDVVLGILLEEKGKLPELARSVDYFVIDGDAEQFDPMLQLVGRMRAVGLTAEFSYKRQNIGKQMKQASKSGAKRVIIVRGDELAVKNMSTGEQHETSLSVFLNNLNDLNDLDAPQPAE